MTDREYIKQLEESNRNLQESLDKALKYVDEIYSDPLQSSLNLMIDISLKQQKELLKNNNINTIKDAKEIHLFLPRQIGLSTSILKTCKKHFEWVDVLNIKKFQNNTIAASGNGVRIHTKVESFRGLRTTCIIVDPWSFLYGSNLLGWDDMKRDLVTSFDTSQPNLLILVG